ncbi:hypothetical protein CERSUDRAFT_66443 [Gelatoporia subvermispora B]|uniref:Uncharacterized protein n=1 Tax=Ceriporiopsis subvermispora (strain B) TaxID=914234 RepID=M2QVK5_CERS8|nr:hypothetical protein CERSUDRAFT_66443 [Gelatoporia subvermispora B]
MAGEDGGESSLVWMSRGRRRRDNRKIRGTCGSSESRLVDKEAAGATFWVQADGCCVLKVPRGAPGGLQAFAGSRRRSTRCCTSGLNTHGTRHDVLGTTRRGGARQPPYGSCVFVVFSRQRQRSSLHSTPLGGPRSTVQLALDSRGL